MAMVSLTTALMFAKVILAVHLSVTIMEESFCMDSFLIQSAVLEKGIPIFMPKLPHISTGLTNICEFFKNRLFVLFKVLFKL